MGLENGYEPENDEEMYLLEDLHTATRRAYARGLSKQEIARMLAFMASATLDPRSLEDGEDDDAATSDEPTCPECGQEVTDFIDMMGGVVELRPCGHSADTISDELVEKLEDEGEFDD